MSQRRRASAGVDARASAPAGNALASTEGTISTTLIASRSTSASSCGASAATSSDTIRTRPPTSSGARNCHTEMSKHCEAFWATVSASVRPRSRILACRWFSIPTCSTIAPFGTPVDPDV